MASSEEVKTTADAISRERQLKSGARTRSVYLIRGEVQNSSKQLAKRRTPNAPHKRAPEDAQQHACAATEATAFLKVAKAAGAQPATFYALALASAAIASEFATPATPRRRFARIGG